MQNPRQHSRGDHLGHEDREVQAAVRFAVLAAAAGIGFLVVAALWVSTCKGAMAVDSVACGAPQRALLAFGAPAILLAAGVWALFAPTVCGAIAAPGGDGRVPAGFC